MPRPEPPQALHLVRLALGTPGEWVILPGGGLRVLALAGKVGGLPGSGWLVCLSGEAIVDLPQRDFVRLRPGEGYAVSAGQPWEALPVKAGTVVLLVGWGGQAEAVAFLLGSSEGRRGGRTKHTGPNRSKMPHHGEASGRDACCPHGC